MEENQKNLSFEATIKKLEEIVSSLENGNAKLEESLDLFGEGVRLVKNCKEMLDSAEQKVKTLVGSIDGGYYEKDFTGN